MVFTQNNTFAWKPTVWKASRSVEFLHDEHYHELPASLEQEKPTMQNAAGEWLGKDKE
jgi:hypothetical protein